RGSAQQIDAVLFDLLDSFPINYQQCNNWNASHLVTTITRNI
ncbi:MAG: hypothetical protein ACI8RD_008069, partial [Bacillariaceae sp.]